MPKPKYLTYQEALSKLEHYCAYQERCHHDVRYKLVSLGIKGDELEQIISELVQEKYLDETRYAKAFARGKLRMNNWGWRKISLALKRKQIPAYDLEQARKEIVSEGYEQILETVLRKKNEKLRDASLFDRKRKLFQFAYGRGFESELISRVLSDLLYKND